MAIEAPAKDSDEEDNANRRRVNGNNLRDAQWAKQDEMEPDPDENDDEEGDEDEEEPRLKYTPVTKNLSSLYRNGDATSAFQVGGDKMASLPYHAKVILLYGLGETDSSQVVGTHNGNIHVLSLPSFQSLRVYHAHSASVSSVSISPFPPPPPTARPEGVSRLHAQNISTPKKPSASITEQRGPPRSPRSAPPVPPTPSNLIYIATSSIDGNVCVSSLIDEKDVTLRNFGRPVQAVALSVDFKNDRSYLSGGLAGNLILTTGGRAGIPENSSTNPVGGAAAAASNWLGSIGLGTNTGKDIILHSGEGAISTIKWSLSGRYVVWVNEQGIKIMRSNILLDSAETEFAWKRISHIDRPNRAGWEEMASVWKARAEWVDMDSLESEDDLTIDTHEPHVSDDLDRRKPRSAAPPEKVVIGWGGTVWVINVQPSQAGDKKPGRAEVASILRTDCIISGISLYTPRLLLVLAYITPDESVSQKRVETTPRKGVHHRQNALEPELRLIDIETKEEVSADTLTVSRFESLSGTDYHLGVLPSSRVSVTTAHRGALEAFGTGIWDATMYPARMFSSAASVRSSTSGEKRSNSKAPSSSGRGGVVGLVKEQQSVAMTEGMKIFIQSPYDCVVAVKRDLADRLAWLDKHAQYQQAWELIDNHPEAVTSTAEKADSPRSPTQLSTLADFFTDNSSQSTLPRQQASNSAAEKEKRRIGELWLEQLIQANDWEHAAQVCEKVLGTSSRWEHWIWIFVRKGKIETITPHIPLEISPPLPSLIYEVVLGHFVSRDRARFREILDLWPPDLFEIDSIIAAIEDQIKHESVIEESEDWKMLTECLAKLFLASGRYRDALHCYIRLQDADAAMSLIRDYHLLDTVADDIPGLIFLRVSKSQRQSAPIDELQTLTAEPIALLVSEALHGIVRPETVVNQLGDGRHSIFLYFYFRSLWRGEGNSPRTGPDVKDAIETSEGRSIVEQFGDTAVDLFADYDRPLLMDFLHASTSYTFSHANAVCEKHHYIPELVHLLSKTGQTKRALFLIIDELKDVTQAIGFAKDQGDPDLWDDLLEYSMDKPPFIRGLLSEVGTAIDPIKLVRRIPSGLEIEGLRDGLIRMIREYDIQASISKGVARVLQGEVAVGMDVLRRGRIRGIKFDVMSGAPSSGERPQDLVAVEEFDSKTLEKEQFGHCVGYGRLYFDEENDTLVGFACGHVYHLAHLDGAGGEDSMEEAGERQDLEDTWSSTFTRSVGPKVTHAFMLKSKIGSGCRLCSNRNAEV